MINREILFRGFLKGQQPRMDREQPDHQWIESSNIRISHYDDGTIREILINGRRVHPESVGQFTGLKDNTKWEQLTKEEQSEWLLNNKKEDWNGKKIFEGDIANVPYNYIGNKVVEFRDGKYNIVGYKISRLEIIGNKFENPELIK